MTDHESQTWAASMSSNSGKFGPLSLSLATRLVTSLEANVQV